MFQISNLVLQAIRKPYSSPRETQILVKKTKSKATKQPYQSEHVSDYQMLHLNYQCPCSWPRPCASALGLTLKGVTMFGDSVSSYVSCSVTTSWHVATAASSSAARADILLFVFKFPSILPGTWYIVIDIGDFKLFFLK